MSNFIQKMWKHYENVSIKWVCLIKIEVWWLVSVSILGHYLTPEISDVVSKYRVFWYRIAYHYCVRMRFHWLLYFLTLALLFFCNYCSYMYVFLSSELKVYTSELRCGHCPSNIRLAVFLLIVKHKVYSNGLLKILLYSKVN